MPRRRPFEFRRFVPGLAAGLRYVDIVKEKHKIVVIAFALLPVQALFHGYLLHIMWSWFAVPLGSPVVGMWHAYGLAVLCRYAVIVSPKPPDPKTQSVREFLDQCLFQTVYGLFLLGMSAVAHAAM